MGMDKQQLVDYFARVDQQLTQPAELLIYGSAAFILLDEENRTSLDLDVAGPYSKLDFDEFCQASRLAGLEVNPIDPGAPEHVEWISGARLCLAAPHTTETITLWQGRHLVVKTVGSADLVASKLIRYDPIDQGDVRYLVHQSRMTHDDVVKAVERLPAGFRQDALVRENLGNLAMDMKSWTKEA
ncbi:MAG: hypothetical protein KBC66_05900 [Kiritimatiellae bacterium]|jgi:hypothetical protein|nr:hypothetical protein [Kiritimatiellia bacterium]NLD90894.1 hypothetical protein [Lentisphaerota bacterium]HOU21243.1 hypothetical protein [Kiritimatiellia bacterium]HPC18800.1 hypothetical protein [Kiritimatiellia bacterium]HQN81061.1 hypothetical protein [Kiritimatiellia bacterium]